MGQEQTFSIISSAGVLADKKLPVTIWCSLPPTSNLAQRALDVRRCGNVLDEAGTIDNYSALAVFTLITSSTSIGCCTDKSS